MSQVILRSRALALFVVAASTSVLVSACNKKGGDTDAKATSERSPDREQPPSLSAMDACARLEAAGIAKNCRRGTALPSGLTLPDASKASDIADFDAQLGGGRTAPGKTLSIASMQTRSLVVFGLAPLKQTVWNSKGVTLYIQSPRKDGDPAYEALHKRMKAAIP